MKLLFIEAGTKYKVDEKGNYYTDGNFNNAIWDRYSSYCDELVVLGRSENKIYDSSVCNKKFNKVKDNIEIVLMKDIYSKKKDFFSLKTRTEITNLLKDKISEADFIIIRSITKFYTLKAAKICRKMNKPYLIEITGSAFDSLWNRGDAYGKILAIPTELKKKRETKKAPNVLYVTNHFLQKEYPNKHNNIGCSDVEISLDESKLKKRIDKVNRINVKKDKIILGTLGPIDSKLKGQRDVIQALYILKNQYGIKNIEYQLVGRGDKNSLVSFIKSLDMEKQINIVGEMAHKDVFDWLESIDIYIQPSYQEGLCRAVVEAMSVGCPIITSNAGGNFELVNNDFMFKKGHINDLVEVLLKFITNDNLLSEAKRSYEEAKKYECNSLNDKRDGFYKSIINLKKKG